MYSEHCQTFKILQNDAQVNQNFLRTEGSGEEGVGGRDVFVELGHFDKRGPAGKHFGNFSSRYS